MQQISKNKVWQRIVAGSLLQISWQCHALSAIATKLAAFGCVAEVCYCNSQAAASIAANFLCAWLCDAAVGLYLPLLWQQINSAAFMFAFIVAIFYGICLPVCASLHFTVFSCRYFMWFFVFFPLLLACVWPCATRQRWSFGMQLWRHK